MTRFAVMDSETDPFEHGRIPQPFIWGIKNEDGVRYFQGRRCTRDFIKGLYDICGSGETLYVYCHNGGKFDFHFLLPFLELEFLSIKLIRGRIGELPLPIIDDKRIRLRDSFLLYPMALAEYKKTAIDYDKMRKENRPENMEEIREYLAADLGALYELMSQWRDNYPTQANSLTLPQAAMGLFRQLCKEAKDDLPIARTSATYNERIRRYYLGGHVYSKGRGLYEGPILHFDLKSAYPHAMLDKHPVGDQRFELGGQDAVNLILSDLMKKDEDLRGRTFVDFVCPSVGLLPYRTGKKVTYPQDGRERLFSLPFYEYAEIARILSFAGKPIKIRRVTIWAETRSFEDYVRPLYEERQKAKAQGDKIREIQAKLLLNSLYGKFASKPDKYRSFEITPWEYVQAASESKGQLEGELGGGALISYPPTMTRYYNVATSASITSYVRARIMRAKNTFGANLIYSDTDSLFIRADNYFPKEKIRAELEAMGGVGSELGQWEEAPAIIENMWIVGPKIYLTRDYEGEEKIAAKGARLTSQQLRGLAERSEPVEYKRDSPTFSLKHEPRFLERTIQ